jgi:hypothetical protein
VRKPPDPDDDLSGTSWSKREPFTATPDNIPSPDLEIDMVSENWAGALLDLPAATATAVVGWAIVIATTAVLAGCPRSKPPTETFGDQMTPLPLPACLDPSNPDSRDPDKCPGIPPDPSRGDPQTCEDAKRNADIVALGFDVRFVDCGRPRTTKGEAFTLGDPISAPPHGPSAVDAKFYAPGQCETGGGAITERNIVYKDEHLGAALDCSRKRCEAGDGLGCRDLGALNWDDLTLPGVKKNEVAASAAFLQGCRLDDGESCWELAFIFERNRHDPEGALPFFIAACKSRDPVIDSCEEAAERLLALGKKSQAKALRLRGCRGVTRTGRPFDVKRSGCGALADLAEKRGDDVASALEYRRLQCAYGGASGSEADDCQVLGIALLRGGDRERALPYLRKSCGILPDKSTPQRQACDALTKNYDRRLWEDN